MAASAKFAAARRLSPLPPPPSVNPTTAPTPKVAIAVRRELHSLNWDDDQRTKVVAPRNSLVEILRAGARGKSSRFRVVTWFALGLAVGALLVFVTTGDVTARLRAVRAWGA